MIGKFDNIQFGVNRGTKSGKYQIYTSISYFFEWISETTNMSLPKCKTQTLFG